MLKKATDAAGEFSFKSSDKKLYFISGGGTGGHIYPAVAIANTLRQEGNKVIFIGNKKNLEYKICKKNEIEFLPVNVNYMPRKFEWCGLKFLFWALKTFVASCLAAIYIKKYKPAAVFATGGYVSAPILIAAAMLKIPYMTHDCDVYPGLVSRFFSKWSSATSIAFEEARVRLKSKNTYFLGNPVREIFFQANKEESREKMGFKCGPQVLLGGLKTPILLIMGGSQGAKALNDAALDLINHFANSDKINIILQTGAKNYDEVISAFDEVLKGVPDTDPGVKKLYENVIIAPYFDDMSIPLSAADLVVSRSGSLSISEICAVGIPSILVPYPFSAADHQRLNAKVMEDIGASFYLDNAHCNGEKLIELAKELIFDTSKLNEMSTAAKTRAKPDATRDIVEKIKEISR